jgi:NADPH-dependent glutamate synthase beta subunit-like oxidoreductase/Pyruvate/2-oxoacid:ferredoxin oxidoreductase delta subunit
MRGHEAVLFDMEARLGGKISGLIPESRIPGDVLDAELKRMRDVLPHIHLKQRLEKTDVQRLKSDYDYVVVASGAGKSRTLNVPGASLAVLANDFLKSAKAGTLKPGARVVIIGAGNVGCDVAAEAHRFGAKNIVLIDAQDPASFGKERKEAEAAGAKFLWPRFTKEITQGGVVLSTGETLPADTVVISIGDVPDTAYLPESVETGRGYVKVDADYKTTDPRIFAVGDAVKPGLLTDAIGAGRKAAGVIAALLEDRGRQTFQRKMIDKRRVTLEYFDPRVTEFEDISACASQCASCGACRDCGICETVCPRGAISRVALKDGFERRADADKCIGCGFCAGVCPCGIWDLVENAPMG